MSNFTGLSGAVNLSSVSSRTEIAREGQLGDDNWGGSVQAAYGFELSSSSVIGFGLNYSLGKSKSGIGYDNKVATDTLNIKNQYSFYLGKVHSLLETIEKSLFFLNLCFS